MMKVKVKVRVLSLDPKLALTTSQWQNNNSSRNRTNYLLLLLLSCRSQEEITNTYHSSIVFIPVLNLSQYFLFISWVLCWVNNEALWLMILNFWYYFSDAMRYLCSTLQFKQEFWQLQLGIRREQYVQFLDLFCLFCALSHWCSATTTTARRQLSS